MIKLFLSYEALEYYWPVLLLGYMFVDDYRLKLLLSHSSQYDEDVCKVNINLLHLGNVVPLVSQVPPTMQPVSTYVNLRALGSLVAWLLSQLMYFIINQKRSTNFQTKVRTEKTASYEVKTTVHQGCESPLSLSSTWSAFPPCSQDLFISKCTCHTNVTFSNVFMSYVWQELS